MGQQVNKHYVVAWDPEGKYWEGALVDHAVATMIRGRGGAALPTDPELFQISGVGGYMRRGWGSGWPLDALMPKAICPLSLYLTTDHRTLYWAARLQADDASVGRAMESGLDLSSSVQIMSYAPRANMFKAPVTPKENTHQIRALGKADERGGWTIGGTAAVHPAMEGVAAFALYGSGAGVRVAWAALSVARG